MANVTRESSAGLSASKQNLLTKLQNYFNGEYSSIMNQAKTDSNFEKMVQSMTVDLLAGKSKLAKNKYNL